MRERDSAIKTEKQRVADLRKMLQKELKHQPSASTTSLNVYEDASNRTEEVCYTHTHISFSKVDTNKII